MSLVKSHVIKILGVVLLLTGFLSAWLINDFQAFKINRIKLPDAESIYDLKPGSSISSVAADFEKRGWIRFREYLKIYARLEDISDIKAGEYLLPREFTAIELLQKFIKGEVRQHQITFIEGWTFKQFIAQLHKNPNIVHTLETLSDQEIMTALGNPGIHPEGQFLAETYHFSKGITDLKILQQAHRALQSELSKYWKNRAEGLPLETPYQALILASIVEKETGEVSERALIAGVFVSRLKKNMKLQTDPTVIYGMGERFDGNIRRKDLREDTPYNTYVHHGLPPTPISMPGVAALKAVMHPNEAGYLYFVAKGDGSHYFSKTLQEHNKAVRKFQLNQ